MQLQDLSKVTQDPDYLTAKLTLISSMSLLGISYGIITILVVLLVFDTATGVTKTVVLEGWDSVSGREFWKGILTKIGIISIPFVLALISVVVKAVTKSQDSYNFDTLILVVLWTVIANDLISFLTNILSIRTRKDYKNKDLIAVMINALRELIFRGAKAAIENIAKSKACDPSEDSDKDKL